MEHLDVGKTPVTDDETLANNVAGTPGKPRVFRGHNVLLKDTETGAQ